MSKKICLIQYTLNEIIDSFLDTDNTIALHEILLKVPHLVAKLGVKLVTK